MDRPSSRSHSTSLDLRDDSRHPLAKACDQCHRCKVACDGERPTCGRCARNGSACTYSTGKPIGKPKGSKNRNKMEVQRGSTSKTDTTSPSQPLARMNSGKRKTSPGAQSVHHKRQRSSVYISSPTSPTGKGIGYTGEPDLSSGASVSSGQTAGQLETQASHTTQAYSVPTPEFLKLQLSPVHMPGLELELSTEQDVDFAEDWMSMADMMNGAQYKTALDACLPTLELSSFTPPGFPPLSSSQVSTEVAHTGPLVNSPPETCLCTSESLTIIPELQQYSTGRITLSVDNVLRLTRRGTSTILSHLDCPHQAKMNSSQTSLLACVLILMQVAACYTLLRGSLDDPEYRKHLPAFTVGGLNIEDDETRRHVVSAVLDAEVRSSVALSRRLEAWGLQLQSAPNALSSEPLLSSVRKELDKAVGR